MAGPKVAWNGENMMQEALKKNWLQRIGHHLTLRLKDSRRLSGYLLNIADQELEIRESAPGEWNSLAGDHITCTFGDIEAAFDNSMEEMVETTD